MGSDLQKILNVSIDTTSPIVTTLCRNELVCELEVLYKDFLFYLDLTKKKTGHHRDSLVCLGKLFKIFSNEKKWLNQTFKELCLLSSLQRFLILSWSLQTWTPWTFFSTDLLKIFWKNFWKYKSQWFVRNGLWMVKLKTNEKLILIIHCLLQNLYVQLLLHF